MKVQLHTSPVTEAFLSQDECPFCYLEKDAQQRAIRFFAGPSASYMEPGIRGITNRLGFCPGHMQKLYDYGNTLGNALMLQTHMEDILLQLEDLSKNPEIPEKKGFFKKSVSTEPAWQQLRDRVNRCAICDQTKESMDRHFQVFFALLEEPEFRQYVEQSKGFCLHHFTRLLEEAGDHLPGKYSQWFYPTVHGVMQRNLMRVKKDLDLLVAKYDYRNAALDWGNARDAVPRAMQKLESIYPTEAPFKKD